MPGLAVSSEDLAAQIAALVREAEGYEARASVATSDEDREKWQRRVQEVREQLRARGVDGAAPHARATKRGRPPAETRA